jgi:hypothetical protein
MRRVRGIGLFFAFAVALAFPFASVAGCSPRRFDARSSPAADIPTAPGPPAGTDAGPTAAATSPPGEIGEPATAACRIAAPDWRSSRLRTRADGRVFAEADRVRATVILPVTATATEAVSEMDDGRILLRAVLANTDVDLFAGRPIALLGVVTPAAQTRLEWKSASPGTLRIAIDTGTVLRAPDPFVADISCTDVRVVEASYDARASVTRKTSLPVRKVIRDGAPLARSAGAESVATLRSGVEVEVIETRGREARILVEDASYVVSGWVRQTEIGPVLERSGGAGFGVGAGRGRMSSRLDQLRCPSDIALFVDIDGDLTKVGLVRKGAGFLPRASTGDDKAGFRTIDLPDSQWLRLAKGVRLAVESAALEACT